MAAPAERFGPALGRGMAAGLLAGVATGVFQLAVGERSVEWAIRLERLGAAGGGDELFTRATQRAGMVLATALYGIVLGGVLAVVVFLLARGRGGTAWERSLRAAAAGFGAFFLVPFLKYPANPPAVGDPGTMGPRTASHLAFVALSVASCLVAVAVARRMAARGAAAPARQLVAGAAYLAVVATAFLALPANPDPVEVPAALLWDFRVASAGGQALLWALTGVGMGLLGLRAARAETAPRATAPTGAAGHRPAGL